MLRVLYRSPDHGWEDVEDVSRISDLRKDGDHLIWADVDATDCDAECQREIEEEFGLDPLAAEDAFGRGERPKVETSSEQHLFALVHELDETGPPEQRELEPHQIGLFLGPSYVLVVHHGAERMLTKVHERVHRDHTAEARPANLLHTLLDEVVDDYEEIVDGLEQETEDLEELALERVNQRAQGLPRRGPDRILQNLYSLKQRNSRVRRFALPLERVLDRICYEIKHEHEPRLIAPGVGRLFSDVHDHLLKIEGAVQNIDYLVQAVLDMIRAEQADVLNDSNKKLSAWAAIVAVPTLVAGIYGMNYRLYPAGSVRAGFWIAVAMMFGLAGGLYAYFKNKGWL